MIKKYTLVTLQKAINKALALDPSLPQKLNSIEGRVLKLVIRPLQLTFFIQFAQGKVLLLDEHRGIADTTIQSSPLGLIRLSLLPASKGRSLFNDDITMTGDIELGQTVKRFFDQIDIDWEGHLAQFTGDAVAYQLGTFVRRGLARAHEFSHAMQQNLTEYVQEEVKWFPSAEEIQDFFNDVDELSLQSDRLAAHVSQLLADHEND